jgi:catechol 2,3-dioxygenase-like lactoylglutathione lyase family enzyme
MLISRLDHFTVRTRRLAEATDFFVQVLGLKVGARPAFPFLGAWLYLGDQPVVHLAEAQDAGDDGLSAYLGATGDLNAKGALDHVAFRCTGYDSFKKRLNALEIEARERIVPELGERQVFLEEPNGIAVELVFPAHEDAEIVDGAHASPAVR